jgi:hypothetical protein
MNEIFTKYEAFEIDWFSRVGGVIAGTCIQASKAMVEEFPELILTRGQIRHNGEPKLRDHWWCVNVSGEVFDVTWAQFGPGPFEYFPIDEMKNPTGKCPNCGGVCYDYRFTCTETCAADYGRYLSRPNEN